jgi:hypothetical protein
MEPRINRVKVAPGVIEAILGPTCERRRSTGAPTASTCTGKISGPPARVSSVSTDSTPGKSRHTTPIASGRPWPGQRR